MFDVSLLKKMTWLDQERIFAASQFDKKPKNYYHDFHTISKLKFLGSTRKRKKLEREMKFEIDGVKSEIDRVKIRNSKSEV